MRSERKCARKKDEFVELPMVDWCALPEGVSTLIARRLQLIEDFIAFRATCSSWRKETTFKDFVISSCPKLPLLIHYKYDPTDSNYVLASVEISGASPEENRKALEEGRAAERQRFIDYLKKHPVYQVEFMSLSKGNSCTFAFPELKYMECIGSNGWLIMAEHGKGNMCLFHPLTRAQIPLPDAPPNVDFYILRSAALSASPSETPDYAVMIACVEQGYISGHYLGFWKPGNKTWTRVEIPDDCVEDLNYCNGKFYALTWKAQVWMFDLSRPDRDNMASKITKLPWPPGSRPKAQLVECGGRLLAVAPFFDDLCDTPYEHDLEMVEIDVIKGSYNILTSLGSSTVFLGRNQGFAIDANRFEGIIEPNLIYFSDGFSRIAAPGPPSDATRPSFCRGVWLNF